MIPSFFCFLSCFGNKGVDFCGEVADGVDLVGERVGGNLVDHFFF